jgi:hypothetical protein
MIIEEKAYKYLLKYFSKKVDMVSQLVNEGKSSLEIAIEVGGNKVIMGSLALLAANYLKKSGPP